jgi:hypothetical protein
MNVLALLRSNSWTNRLIKPTLVLSVLTAGSILFSQGPALSQLTTGGDSSNQSSTTEHPVTSPSDVLLVQLNDGADREHFNNLIEEVHGTYIRTITAGSLKILVIQAAPGSAADLEKRLGKDKNVHLVERNRTIRIKDLGFSREKASSFENHALSHHQPSPGHHHNFVPPHHNKGGTGGGTPTLTGVPNDPYFQTQYNLALMNFAQARDSGVSTRNVGTLYVLDTGVAPNQEFPTVITQYDFSTDNSIGAVVVPYDSGFHGTAVSSVTAFTDNAIGISGVANLEGQRCVLKMFQITPDGESTDILRIFNALTYIATTSGLPPGPINISFGPLNGDPFVQAAAQQLHQMGFRVVIAAGNDGTYDSSPEQFCTRVAACDQNGNLATFSTTGPFVACAPGVNIGCYIPFAGEQVFGLAGTSLSAPTWCACMLILMAQAHISADRADAILKQTGTSIGQGFIIPNLKAAVQAAGQ